MGDKDFPARDQRRWIACRRFIAPCASDTSLPGWSRLFLSATLLSVIGITIYVGKKTSGEISEFRTHRSLWRI